MFFKAVLCSLVVTIASVFQAKASDFAFDSHSLGGAGSEALKDNAAGLTVRFPDIAAIAVWVSQTVGIPTSAKLPNIEVVPPERFTTVVYRRLVENLGDEETLILGDPSASNRFDNVVAFYENASQTIFLREGWTGTTAADVSVLVHEMVHHLQSMAGTKYACPAAAEKLAYAAQRKWLEQVGRDFFVEFGTDQMTLLVRTTCGS